MKGRRIYLDYNASAPLLEVARDAVVSALGLSNPSSVHAEGRAARAVVEQARQDVAGLVGAGADRVVFTSGATEAANTLLTPDWTMKRSPVKASRLYVLEGDHACMSQGGRFAKENIIRLPVSRDGIADLVAMKGALAGHDHSHGVPLVAVVLAHNETGVVQDRQAIAALVRDSGGISVFDAVQAAGRISLDISDGCGDFLTLSSHKIGGPKGAGAIVSASNALMPVPLVAGGGQERGHRSGTESVGVIAGFGVAARAASRAIGDFAALETRRASLETEITKRWQGAEVHCKEAPARLPNTIFVTLPGLTPETGQIAFDLEGIALSAGSACSSGKVGRSAVLSAMGVESNGALRISFSPETTGEEFSMFLDVVSQLASRTQPGMRLAG